jgi:hypothetical protein
MKTLLLGALLLLSTAMFCQDTFVKRYTSYVTKKNGVISEFKDGIATIVFNEGDTTNIVIYCSNDGVTLYRKGKIEEAKTSGGESYQGVYCVNAKDGKDVYLQLFLHCTRIFTGSDFIEYHE